MGSEYIIRTYKDQDKLSLRKEVDNEIMKMNYECGDDTYSGHWGAKTPGINFCPTTFKTQEEADNWLQDNNEKWEPVGACFFDDQDTNNQGWLVGGLCPS